MCGIAGIFNLNQQPVSHIILEKMNSAIAHRGPDGDGIWAEGNIGLGHRRLSIIDLSAHGHQPMRTSDHRFIISYNGEVYNFKDIRIELESIGYTFHSKTDTEVVLKAFSAWGPKAVLKFNGMFAFAIWDCTKQELYLVRDRYGIKPLYYTIQNNQLIFASEIKAIFQHPTVKANINHHGLVEYLTFQNFISDNTIFENIHIIPAGHIYTFNKKNQQSWQYWDFNFQQCEEKISQEEYTEQLEYLILQAVNRQLVSDVKLGAYLSGGMDSATLTAIAAKQLPFIKTFTCGFDISSISGIEQTYDERRDAEHMSYLFRTEHYEMVLKAGDMERCMPQLAYHIEEPRVGQSYPNFYAAKLASKFGKVVLAGTAGDEIFAGYPWRYYQQANHENSQQFLHSYFKYWQRIFTTQEQQKLFAPIWPEVKTFSSYDLFKSIFNTVHLSMAKTPEDYVNQCLYFESKTFLHGLLTIEDKLSMAHGLESRVPFLDNDLVDFAMKIPVQYKLANLHKVQEAHQKNMDISDFLTRSKDGKIIFRNAMKNHLPVEIINKTKQGFSAPDASWFKGESIEYVKKLLLNDKAYIYQFLDRNVVKHKLQQHFRGEQNNRLLIWSLLSLEVCFDTFLDPQKTLTGSTYTRIIPLEV